MVVCHICKEEFKDNSGGQLTNHLKKVHDKSWADYVVITELKGIEPKCACRFCDERPSMYRGKFKKYATGHDRFKWIENQYISKYGTPKCKKCNSPVKFLRGKPNTYCTSNKCRPNNWNQTKVKATVKEKYRTNNVMDVKLFRDKIKEANTYLWKHHYNEQLEKMKKTSMERYGVEFASQNEFFKEKQRMTLIQNYGVTHYSKTDKFRKESSKRMMLNNPYQYNTIFRKKYKETNLTYDSSYEFEFLEICENKGILHLIKKSPTFHYFNKDSYHFPDYLFDDKYIIEIKSTWILNQQGGMEVINEKIKSLEGKYEYILILDKNYSEFEKIIKQT